MTDTGSQRGDETTDAHAPAVGRGRSRSPIARLADRLPDGLADAVWLWLLLRVGLSILAIFMVVEGRAQLPCPTDAPLSWLPHDGLAFPLLGVWHHWDACWYTTIAASGYGTTPGTGATTFFPLLPLLAGVVAGVKGNLPIAFAAINAVALILALTGLHQLVARDFDRPTAARSVLYVVVFPSAFFLIAPFTESLFLAASVWAFIGARSRRWEIALVAGIIAGLTRPQGILLMLPLAWEAVRMLWERWHAGGPRVRPSDILAGLAVAAPGVAYLGFLGYSTFFVGESYFASHASWGGHELVVPWDRLAAGVSYALDHGKPVLLLNAVLWPLFVGLTIAGVRLLPVSYWIYVVPQLVLALTQDTAWPLMSLVRYVIILFPCFVVLAIAGRNRRFHLTWVVLSTMLLATIAGQFLSGMMVG